MPTFSFILQTIILLKGYSGPIYLTSLQVIALHGKNIFASCVTTPLSPVPHKWSVMQPNYRNTLLRENCTVLELPYCRSSQSGGFCCIVFASGCMLQLVGISQRAVLAHLQFLSPFEIFWKCLIFFKYSFYYRTQIFSSGGSLAVAQNLFRLGVIAFFGPLAQWDFLLFWKKEKENILK